MPETGASPSLPAAHHLELLIEYTGANFAGWQVQPDRRTPQGEIERALAELTGEQVRIVGASRTDAGVHALGQVASFAPPSAVEPRRLLRGLNALLPQDVAVLRVREVPATFHARFSARGKHYRYRILTGLPRRPLEEGRLWHHPAPLDLEAMRRAAGHLEGRQDFRALVSRPDGDGDCVRHLHAVRVGVEPALLPRDLPAVLAIDVVGDGFLYKMVRTIAGTLAHVGRGKLDPDALPEVLRRGERRGAGPTAPPEGLYLVRVFYSDEELRDALEGVRTEGVEHADHHHGPRRSGPGRGAPVRRGEGREARAV